MGQQKSLADQKWTILLQSSKKFVALAKYRKEEKDYMEAVSVLNQTLLYVSPQAFKDSPHHILRQMIELNIQIYLELAQIFVQLRKYDVAKGCLIEIFKSDQHNLKAKQLVQKINQEQKQNVKQDHVLLEDQLSQNTC